MANYNPAQAINDDAEFVATNRAVPEATVRASRVDLGETEPSESELTELADVAATAQTEDLPAGVLARYFRDMAVHAVMAPMEEIREAQAFEAAEIDRWRAALAYPPAMPIVARTLESCLLELSEPVALPEFEKLRKLLKEYRKNRSKLDRRAAGRWTAVTGELATRLRVLDADRLYIEAVESDLARVANGPDETSDGE